MLLGQSIFPNGVTSTTATVGTNTTQTATTAFVFANTDLIIRAYQSMGSTIKAMPLGETLVDITSYTTLSDGRAHYIAVYLPYPQTITGVKALMNQTGDYTADQYNGVGLYSVSGGTLTLRASSTDDGNIWKATVNTVITKAFTTPYSAPAGLYYIAIVYNQSAQTTAPRLGATGNGTVTGIAAWDFTNDLKTSGTVDPTNTLPTPTIAASGITAYVGTPFVALY